MADRDVEQELRKCKERLRSVNQAMSQLGKLRAYLAEVHRLGPDIAVSDTCFGAMRYINRLEKRLHIQSETGLEDDLPEEGTDEGNHAGR